MGTLLAWVDAAIKFAAGGEMELHHVSNSTQAVGQDENWLGGGDECRGKKAKKFRDGGSDTFRAIPNFRP